LRHTSGGLGCKEGGYIRGKELHSKEERFLGKKVRNRKANSVLLDKN